MLKASYRFLNHREDLIEKIHNKLGSNFTPAFNQSGVTFFGPRGRILKMVSNSRWLYFEFNVPVPVRNGLTILTKEQAKEKHMGTCRWIYKGNSLDEVYDLIENAIEKY